MSVGGVGRLTAELGGGSRPRFAVVRWMATGGSFFELDLTTTDWAAGEVQLDDDERRSRRWPSERGQ